MAMMTGGSTVFDRMKKNGGYITGPRHQFGPSMDDQEPNEAPEDGGDTPPNLRDAGDSPDSCASCEYFEQGDSGGSCQKFNGFSVSANEICDAFEPQDQGDDESAEGMGGGGMMRSPDAESAY